MTAQSLYLLAYQAKAQMPAEKAYFLFTELKFLDGPFVLPQDTSQLRPAGFS